MGQFPGESRRENKAEREARCGSNGRSQPLEADLKPKVPPLGAWGRSGNPLVEAKMSMVYPLKVQR